MTSTSLFLLTTALAVAEPRSGEAIGISTPVPEQPSVTKPTWSRSRGLAIAQDPEERPKLLVPVGYLESKTNWWGRYYDDNGNIYRGNEVMVVLTSSGLAEEEIADYKRHQMISSISNGAAVFCYITLVGIVPGMAFSGVSIYFSIQAGKDIERALVSFNENAQN